MEKNQKKRVLFIAESVTLAHLARPLVLTQALDPKVYDVHFACDPRYQQFLRGQSFSIHSIHSIPSEAFLAALEKGEPLYSVNTLRSYVKEELALIETVDPDILVGDFRLSLAVSAPTTGIPYIAIINAYWSPFAKQQFPMPSMPMSRYIGKWASEFLFRIARPFAFAYHTRPLNRLRREYALPDLGLDLRNVYSHADFVLYPDIPELVPTFDLPPNHQYLGSILWSPPVEYPSWWNVQVLNSDPLVYVTLGSSGQIELLPMVLDALGDLPVTVLAATAGRVEMDNVPRNTYVAGYLPGVEASKRASLVICNGGSPTTQQALTAGVPVLGIASNMDQHLNMGAVQRFGAGKLLRSEQVGILEVRMAVAQMLDNPAYGVRASILAKAFARYDMSTCLNAMITKALGSI